MSKSTFSKSDFGDKFISDYLKAFEMHSIKNELYGRFALHVILGQSLKNVCYTIGQREIDIRTHMFLIKAQGSGKGAGYGFCKKLSDFVGLEFVNLTETTDGGLAGSKQYDPQQKKEVIVDGVLKNADIVGMEEANVLIDLANDFSKKNMTYMQITMNPLSDESCYIHRRLVGMDIEFKPHASFLLMTYPPDKITEKIVKTGFMDRMIVIFEEVSLEDRLEVLKRFTEMVDIKNKNEVKKNEESVFKRLRIIIKHFQKTPIKIAIQPEIHNLILKCIDEATIMILDSSPKAREKLEHFISRLYDIFAKLAIHHALMNLRTTLKVEDVMYARLSYLPVWRNLIISIESLLIISPEERHRKHHIKLSAIKVYKELLDKKMHTRGNYVRRLTMIQHLQPLWDNCSKETADSNLAKIEKIPGMDIKGFKGTELKSKDKCFERKYIGDVAYIKMIN